MQLSFSFLAVATVFAAAAGLSLVSAHPAQQLKRVTTTTPPPSPTSTTALGGDAGIPTHASTVTNALPAAIKTTPPSSCTFFFLFFSFFSIPHPACSLSSFSQRGEKIFPLDNILRAGPPPPQMIYFYPSKKREKSLVPFHNFFFFFSLYITENITRFN